MAETLGARIKRIRLAYGMSQAELARRIGVSKNTMYQIEAGKTPDPQVSRIQAIARVLNTSPNVLLGYDEDVDPRFEPALAETA